MNLDRVTTHEPVAVPDAERRAAVLAPILERDGSAHIVFIKRADHLGEHAGQMAFPGGGAEPSDANLTATALREAREEIDLSPEGVDLVGRLDDIRTITGYAVTPFVARVPNVPFTPDGREAAEVAILPVTGLIDRKNYESERRDHPHHGDIRIHFFHVDGYTVWGATGRILVQLLELATDWRVPPAVDRVVDPDADLPL